MADRIRRPQQFEEFLSELREKEIFKTYKDAMVFAACLGYSRGKRVPFDKTSEPINIQIFSGEFDPMVINILAIAETDDPHIMAKNREDDKIRIFEEHACGGLEIMKHELGEGQLALDESLLNMIMQEEESEKILEDITGLAEI